MQRNQLIIRVVVFCCVAPDPSFGASEIVAGRQAEADGATSPRSTFKSSNPKSPPKYSKNNLISFRDSSGKSWMIDSRHLENSSATSQTRSSVRLDIPGSALHEFIDVRRGSGINPFQIS